MERALDDWTGEVVRARQVKDLHVYRCLFCGEEVLFAPAPRAQDARFQHRHDDVQACTQFQLPGGRLDRVWQSAPPRRGQPALCALPRRSGTRLTWHLEFYLPGFPVEFDTFEILHDVHPSWHDLAELPHEGARFEVVPVEGGFSATAYRRGHPVAACPLAGTVGLLSRRTANVFDHRNGGRQLDVEAPLSPGRDYLVLAPAFKVLPPHPQVELRELAAPNPNPPYSLWRGYLLSLTAEEPTVAEWCEQHLYRTLQFPPPRLDVVFPPVLNELADGTLVLPQGERVFLALRGGPNPRLLPVLLIRHEQTQALRGVCLGPIPEASAYIELGSLPPGDYTVLPPAASALALQLRVIPASVPEVPAVKLSVLDSAGQRRLASLHESSAAAMLDEVVIGSTLLEQILVPEGVGLTLLWQRAAESTWEPWPVAPGRSWTEALTDCLNADPAGMRLDAGAFGSAEGQRTRRAGGISPLLAPRTRGLTANARKEVKTLPAALRRRIQWLFQARLLYHAHPPGDALGIALPADLWERLAETDRHLVRQLREALPWPAALLAHARAAGRDLARFLQNDR